MIIPRLVICLFLFLTSAGWFAATAGEAIPSQLPLPYRTVSFQGGKADMELIKLAREAGYNGVQIQLEYGNLNPLQKFAEYNKRTKLIAQCHDLGMQVSVWIHELSDVPDEFLLKRGAGPLKPGEVVCHYGFSGDQQIIIDINDPRLWALLDQRYEHILKDLIPDADALVLTVTETQVHATDPKLFIRLVQFLNAKCKKYGKRLHVRTFVWHLEDFKNLMTTIQQLPEDVIIMSKCVPQDWHLRSINGLELGQVGNHEQIEEWDVEGEYFGKNKLVNCMPALLQQQLAYGVKQGIKGICVRVDRDDQSVLHRPSEVNMWALGLLSSGKCDSVDDVWKTWAARRYGVEAGPAIIPALIHSTDVVQEALYIDNYSFFDSRQRVGPASEPDPFQHLANPQFWSDDYQPLHDRLVRGDAEEIAHVESNKLAALRTASNSIVALERARPLLETSNYTELRQGLLANQVQLGWRASMHLAYLRHRLLVDTSDAVKREELTIAIRKDLQAMRSVVENAATNVASDGDQALRWADEMEQLLR